ncbi:MAG: hypothetical protein SGJ19_23950 [Planctomycetia bacterium]|nr:hypothetical protein [Planctomycetia bacterium]
MSKLAILDSIRSALLAGLVLCSSSAVGAEEVVINFEQVPVKLDPTNDEAVNRLERYVDKGVEFKLARSPERSKARGRIMFFSHITSGRTGILNAMADEQQIPVQVQFPQGASAVTIVFWASTGTSARLAAFNSQGEIVARSELEMVPGRKKPEDPVPTFELEVKAGEISYVQFNGPRTSEYLVAEEVRFVPLDTQARSDP